MSDASRPEGGAERSRPRDQPHDDAATAEPAHAARPANVPHKRPTSFDDLEPHERRRLFVRSTIRILGTTALLITLYAVVPVVGESGTGAALELTACLIAFIAILGWQIRSIFRADHPELRAIEALAITIPVVIIVFAFTYLSMWKAHHGGFSQPLDRVGAFYFTVTVLGTVGFGDIVARTDATRIVVTIQIIVDLVLTAAVVRMLLLAARAGVRQRANERSTDRDDR